MAADDRTSKREFRAHDIWLRRQAPVTRSRAQDSFDEGNLLAQMLDRSLSRSLDPASLGLGSRDSGNERSSHGPQLPCFESLRYSWQGDEASSQGAFLF